MSAPSSPAVTRWTRCCRRRLDSHQLMAATLRHPRLVHPIGTATSSRERLFIAIAVGAMGSLGFAVTPPLLPDLADAFEVSRGAIGLVQAAVSVPGVLFSGLIGYFADRVGRRRVILVSLLLFSTFGIAGFFARSFWGLIAVRFVQGIGTSGILGVGIVLIGDLFEGADRMRAMGINLTLVTFAGMVTPMLSGLLGTIGIFVPFLIFAIGYPLALWASRLPSDAESGHSTPVVRHFGDAIDLLRRNSTLIDFLGMLVATLAATFVLHGLGLTTTPLFLDEVFGTPVSLRGIIIGSFQIGVIAIAFRIGRVRSRLGTPGTITSGFALMSAGTAVAMVAPGPWVVAAGLALAGVGFGMYVPLAQEYAARVGTAVYRGVTVLTWVTVVRIAQMTGPPVGSFLADTVGPRFTFGLAAVGLAILAVAWGPLRSAIKRRRAQPSVDPTDTGPAT